MSPSIGALIIKALLHARVADVFYNSPFIDRIDFHLEGIHISPQRLRAVGDAFRDGRIGIEFGNTGKLLSAAYTPGKNRRMTLRDWDVVNNRKKHVDIFHEGVHALVDLFFCNVTDVQDETLAYIAEANYARVASINYGNLDSLPIYKTAFDLVDKHQMRLKTGVKLQAEDYADLVKAIRSNAAYKDLTDKAPVICHADAA